jgi:hypothetical protein
MTVLVEQMMSGLLGATPLDHRCQGPARAVI